MKEKTLEFSDTKVKEGKVYREIWTSKMNLQKLRFRRFQDGG
jgi:hypothetical protein